MLIIICLFSPFLAFWVNFWHFQLFIYLSAVCLHLFLDFWPHHLFVYFNICLFTSSLASIAPFLAYFCPILTFLAHFWPFSAVCFSFSWYVYIFFASIANFCPNFDLFSPFLAFSAVCLAFSCLCLLSVFGLFDLISYFFICLSSLAYIWSIFAQLWPF